MTLLKFDLQQALIRELGRKVVQVPAVLDLETWLDSAEITQHEFDLDELLSEHHLIGIVWNTQLVLAERPDLTEEQAWEVLSTCQCYFEEPSEQQLEVVRKVAQNLYPPAREAKEALQERLRNLMQQVDALPSDSKTNPAAFGLLAARIDTLEATIRGIA
jgi:hypothetical protein